MVMQRIGRCMRLKQAGSIAIETSALPLLNGLSKRLQIMSMPKQQPAISKQDYRTPQEFLGQVKKLLKIDKFTFDFAADCYNYVSPSYYTEQQDALVQDWSYTTTNGWGWLNPPYRKIEPWAAKCDFYNEPSYEDLYDGERIAFLVPASVGSNWFKKYIYGKHLTLALNGRLAFIPDKPSWLYPKDLMLVLFGLPWDFKVWDWKHEIINIK